MAQIPFFSYNVTHAYITRKDKDNTDVAQIHENNDKTYVT